MKKFLVLPAVLSAVILAGCGGGGNSDSINTGLTTFNLEASRGAYAGTGWGGNYVDGDGIDSGSLSLTFGTGASSNIATGTLTTNPPNNGAKETYPVQVTFTSATVNNQVEAMAQWEFVTVGTLSAPQSGWTSQSNNEDDGSSEIAYSGLKAYFGPAYPNPPTQQNISLDIHK